MPYAQCREVRFRALPQVLLPKSKVLAIRRVWCLQAPVKPSCSFFVIRGPFAGRDVDGSHAVGWNVWLGGADMIKVQIGK